MLGSAMPILSPTPIPASAAVPTGLTTFVGREREVAALGDLLASARLVTLTGAGGSGKTRLAGEVARVAGERFADGVAWIELAAVTDSAVVTAHVAATLGIGGVGRAPADALRDGLRNAELLIMLDNCEHVVDACAATADLLLRDCPVVSILAASREALGIPGERAWLVPVLSLPTAPSLAAAAQSEAVSLFVERARAASGSFALTSANVGAVAQLCSRLDGLPLAIELAAARARALTPEQMLSRLDGGQRILETGRRTGGRHRTLR